MLRHVGVVIAFVAACGGGGDEPARAPAIEGAIGRALGARLGVAVTARCTIVARAAFACQAELADGTRWPIAIDAATEPARWRVAGRVIETAPIARYVQSVLDDYRIAQRATCGPPLARLEPGGRIACALSGGGAAFVEVAPDGRLAVELAVDRPAAAARTSGESEARLLERSRALDQGDEADEPPPKGGADEPAP